MKKLFLVILSCIVIACSYSSPKQAKELPNEILAQENKKLNQVLESKFGKPITIEKYAVVFVVYTWTSFEEEYGRRFKNEIDKFLNILPQKTDTKLTEENNNAVITDTYEWETPLIYVSMEDKFKKVDGKIKSIIKIKINEK